MEDPIKLAQEANELERTRINDERKAKRVKVLLDHIDSVMAQQTGK